MGRIPGRAWFAALALSSFACTFDSSGVGSYERARHPDHGPRADGVALLEGGSPDWGALIDLPAVPLDSGGPPPEQAEPCAGLSCPLSCNAQANRCFRVQPTNFSATAIHDTVAATLGSTGGPLITIDTDEGAIVGTGGAIRPPGAHGVANGIYWSVEPQQRPGAPELAVFGVAALEIPQGTTVRVVGHRAFALYAAGNVVIAGTLTAAADKRDGGPGGFEGGLNNGADAAGCFGGGGSGGGETGSGTSQIETGGGGGGRKADGGRGGTAAIPNPNLAGGAGGIANGAPALSPLYGGCGGGAGGGPDTGGIAGNGGYGGGGGGAVHLAASGTITVTGTGTITAPGAGGGGGHYGAGGGGGGSGGAIFLEAASVSVGGILAANGGGGGAASPSTSTANVDPGQDGQPSTQHAAGGTSKAPDYGGAGGTGGALGRASGDPGADVQGNTGGGGGAAGRIRINAPAVAQVQIGPQNASPAPGITASLALW